MKNSMIPSSTRSIPPEYWENRSLFRNRIISVAKPLVKSLARRYCGGSVDRYDDLEGVAYMALNSAIDSYEPGRAAFSTHAVTKIRSDILHYIRDNSTVPRVWIESFSKVRAESKKINQMRSKFGHTALTLAQVAERLKIQEWDRIVAAMDSPNPIGLVGVEQEYQPRMDEDDLVLMVRQVLFQIPQNHRNSIELWMYRNKRDHHFPEAFESVKALLIEAVA